MLQRLTSRDWLFFTLVLIGVVIAILHMAMDSVLTGVLVLGGILIGVIVRSVITFDSRANDATARNKSRALDRSGSWNEGPDESGDDVWLRSGVIAGFAATVAMSVIFVAGYLIAGIFADQDASTVSGWFYGLTHNSLTDDASEIPLGAYSINLIAGVIWALIYGFFFVRRLRGAGWWRGVQFSLLPWLLSLIVFFPITGAGFFGIDLNAGPLPVIGNLILHLVYGSVLGSLYAVLSTRDLGLVDERILEAGWIDQGLAIGLAGGLAIGLVLGAFAGLVIEVGNVTSAELTLAGGAIGILGGVLVGPLIGLETGSSQEAPRTG